MVKEDQEKKNYKKLKKIAQKIRDTVGNSWDRN